RLVADAADPVLGLPGAAALDAETCPDGVVNTESEQLARRGRRSLRQLDRVAEEQREPRTARTEGGGRREREIDLQAARQQKDPIDRSPGGQVEQVRRVELGRHRASPA